MITRPESLEKLLALLRTLPAVGPKMSERIAFHILMSPEEHINALAQTILETYKNVKPCSVCGYWDDTSPCRICSDSSRDPGLICVVENPQDLIANSAVELMRRPREKCFRSGLPTSPFMPALSPAQNRKFCFPICTVSAALAL